MFKFFALISLLAAVVSASLVPIQKTHESSLHRRPTGRIINGTETTIEANPYQISLRIDGFKHNCGGSIISKNWVITAAHCFEYDATHYSVLAGTANLSKGGSHHRASKFIIHENNRVTWFGSSYNDIALIRVEEPFEFDETRKPISLYAQDEETVVGSISVIPGWGSTEYGNPDVLNLVEVPIIAKEKCEKLYDYLGGIGDGQICAVYEEGGKGSCHGDSGGPLTINGRLACIVSWGDGCAIAGKPTVYTDRLIQSRSLLRLDQEKFGCLNFKKS